MKNLISIYNMVMLCGILEKLEFIYYCLDSYHSKKF